MRYYGLKGGRLFGLFFHHKVPKIWYKGSGWAKSIALVPVTGPRRKRSQYWPWICAPGNTGMASHLGRRLMQMRNQYWPRAILQYCPRAILQYYPRSILQYWPRAILQYCPWSILASGLKLACDLNGRSYPNCLGHISMVNTETSSYMVLSH